MPAATRTKPGGDLVHAALRPDEPPFAHLVSHGVCQRLHWCCARDSVPVQMNERVQLIEPEASVAPQNGEAR